MNTENGVEYIPAVTAGSNCFEYDFKKTLDLISGVWLVMDNLSRLIYYNKNFTKMFGVDNLADDYLIGKTQRQIPANIEKTISYLYYGNRSVYKSGQVLRYIYCHSAANGEWMIIEIVKYPIFNSKGEVETILVNCVDQTSNCSLDLALAMSKEINSAKYLLTNTDGVLIKMVKQHVELKAEEEDCLFYLARGFSHKQIAEIQRVAYRTIIHRLQRLMSKFNASTSNDLIIKSLTTGHANKVPKNMLNKPMLVILSGKLSEKITVSETPSNDVVCHRLQCANKKFKQVLDMLPGAWAVLDKKSCFLYYNEAYSKVVGTDMMPKDYLIGKTTAAIPSNLSKCAKYFWHSDLLVKQTKNKVRILNCLLGANDQWLIFEIHKTPVFNADNELEAILCQYVDQTDNHAIDLVLSLSGDANISKEFDTNNICIYDLFKTSEQVALKPRELECLFYLSRGFSNKEIARRRNIAYRTLTYHIDELKAKFSVSTVAELVVKAIASGYLNSLPKNLFPKQMVIIMQD